MFIILSLFLLLGLCLGSFVNAWVWRTKTGRSIATERSMCPHCKHQLKWYENMPLISYIMLKGKCSNCNKPISIQYPLVELSTGLLFVALYWHFGPIYRVEWLELAGWCLATVFLVAAFVYDYHYMQLPDRFMLPVIGIGIALVAIQVFTYGWGTVVPQLLATAVFGGLYFALWFFSGGRFLGDGDIRLAVAMGLLLTVPQLLVAIFISYLLGATVGVVLIASKKKKRTDPVPFGPFLIIGLYLGLFYGLQISNWYLGLF